MTSERKVAEDGFALIEVLIAMVILAIGLLGLEALGIGVARSLALAERQSGYASIATDSLETALHALRRQTLPSQFCLEGLQHGDRLSRIVDVSNPQSPVVTVRAIPGATDLIGATDTFTITSSLYLPVAIPGAISGTPCS